MSPVKVTRGIIVQYRPSNKISAPEGPAKYQQLQWLYFQASGQGPYFGQLIWFMRYHKEQVPSAIERYAGEVRRVFGVLESVLSKQEWLVGDKITVADITFIPLVGIILQSASPWVTKTNFNRWNRSAIHSPDFTREGYDWTKEFPATAA